MNCPKCNHRMHGYNGFSASSQLEQQEALTQSMIAGYSCIMCGTFVDSDVVPICPKPEIFDWKNERKAYKLNATDKWVVLHKSSIIKLLKQGASLISITKLLRYATGSKRISEKFVNHSLDRLKQGVL